MGSLLMLMRRRYRYALRDRFDTAAAAPLTSPRTAEPGPGIWTIRDTGSKLSISSGAATFAAGGATWNDPGMNAAALARVAGRAFIGTFTKTVTTGLATIGWYVGTATAAGPAPDAFYLNADTIRMLNASGSPEIIIVNAAGTGTAYQFAIVMRATGLFYLIRGGTFAAWALLWVDAARTGSQTPTVAGLSAGFTNDDLRVTDLGGAWASDYGIATTRLASTRADGDAFTHTADFIGEWTIGTLPASGTIDYEFRRQDASNLWKVSVTSAGAINLYERVTGSDTSRASGTGVANGNRLVVIASGSSISMFAANTQKGSTYASASGFATLTSGRLALPSGAVTEIIAWPCTVSLPSGV